MMVRLSHFPVISAIALGIAALCMGCGSNTASVSYAPPDAQPTFDPPGDNNWTTPHTVTILDTIAASSFYYTTDGSGPTTSSTPYTGPITISQTETLRAIAIAPGYSASVPRTQEYIIGPTLVVLTPVISPAQASGNLPVSVTISDAMSGATIYYTTDGTAPTPESMLYTGPISVTSTETIQALAVANGYKSSAVAKAAFAIGGTGNQ